jgi:EAL domain-containing protein (putative c-di-GMP-specific phosphodiesterase class I)
LIRWNHPEHGIIMPRDFIPIAESTGLIVPLGAWILRQACADAASWPAAIAIAVNLSPVQFGKGNIVETVSHVLSQTGLAPGRLELEITESVLLRDDEPNVSKLHQLKAFGVSIVLDDFGTGYSSLSYLRMFPFDKIKIDRSFVAEIATRSDCAAIVTAIIGLARCLDMVTTAEGVETNEQFELLRIAGCGQMQGFLFGVPVPISKLEFNHALADARVA